MRWPQPPARRSSPSSLRPNAIEPVPEMSTTPQPAGLPAYSAAIASPVTSTRVDGPASCVRIARPRSRSAGRSPPAHESTIATAVASPSDSASAAPIEPAGSGDESRLAPPPAPRPTTDPSRSTAKARVFDAPASIPIATAAIRGGGSRRRTRPAWLRSRSAGYWGARESGMPRGSRTRRPRGR